MAISPEAGASPATVKPAPPGRRLEDLLTLAGPYLGLLLVMALFSYLTWQRGELSLFLSLDNLKLVVVHASIPAAVALGMTMIMISGGIDLSVGYVVSLVTVTTEAPLIETEKTEQSQNISEELVSNLPTGSRRWTST